MLDVCNTYIACLFARSSPNFLISSLISNSVTFDPREAASAPFPKDMVLTLSLSRTTSSSSLGGWSSRCSREATLVCVTLRSSCVCYEAAICAVAWIFLGMSTYQMYVWAVKKHRLYRKEFGSEYPKDRKAMFPFIA